MKNYYFRDLGGVVDDFKELKKAGVYEKHLIEAYTSCKCNNREWETEFLDLLLLQCDKTKSLKEGALIEPLFNDKKTIKVYRGVSGLDNVRRAKGQSWTTDLDVAKWYALRFGAERPEVYQTTIKREHIYCYAVDMGESEIIIRSPSRISLVKISLEEMRAGAERVIASRK